MGKPKKDTTVATTTNQASQSNSNAESNNDLSILDALSRLWVVKLELFQQASATVEFKVCLCASCTVICFPCCGLSCGPFCSIDSEMSAWAPKYIHWCTHEHPWLWIIRPYPVTVSTPGYGTMDATVSSWAPLVIACCCRTPRDVRKTRSVHCSDSVSTSNPTPIQSVLPSTSALAFSPTFDRSHNPSPNPQIDGLLLRHYQMSHSACSFGDADPEYFYGCP